MCGIAGILDWTRAPDLATLSRMTDAMAHRGPDAESVVLRGQMALGHRRLSVIDVSAAANQPMRDESGRYWIVFNGEIYNYRELRDDLARHGAEFVTRSDTEVILEAYKKWGDACTRHFNGMFAFAIWDEVGRRLFVARDRIGKKPLFYAPLPGRGVVFASELKALRLHPAVGGSVDPTSLGHYLALSYPLSSDCIAAGVHSVPPAHSMVVDEGGIHQPVRFWDLAESFRSKPEWRSKDEAADQLADLIDDAVRLRLIADVPLGAFLSGGIDSATVVSAMCRLRPPSHNKTYSIDFTEDTYSEVGDARETASALGVDHSDRVVDVNMAEALPRIIKAADQPFADTSIIPTYYLAQFARESVTVALSGDGGDEIFAGYETYRADRVRHLTAWVPGPMVKGAARLAARWPVSFDKVSFDYKLRQFLANHSRDQGRAHYAWREIFNKDERRRLVRPDRAEVAEADAFEAGFAPAIDEVRACHYIDQAMYTDIKTWLVDDIMVKVDRATMAHSLEARAPLLDHRVVEFAAGLPVEWKLRGFETKHLLKRSQRRHVPPSVLRRPKRGFGAPMSHWLADGLGKLAKEVTMDPSMNEWFQPTAISRLWRDHEARRADNGLKLFTLTCFGLWLR